VFGDVPLADLECHALEIAAWRAGLSERLRYPATSALRQALDAAIRWELMSENPAKKVTAAAVRLAVVAPSTGARRPPQSRTSYGTRSPRTRSRPASGRSSSRESWGASLEMIERTYGRGIMPVGQGQTAGGLPGVTPHSI
jgi:hypothetical protein